MTVANDIREALARFLDAEVEVAEQDGRVALTTPAEYPDGDAVVIWLSDHCDGIIEASDLGGADARLIATGPGARALGVPAAAIARRLDVSFAEGTLSARAQLVDLPEAIWRVAQAAAALAEAATFHRQQAPKEAAFLDMVERALRAHDIEVEQEAELQGASGHSYTATLFIPSQEAVVEPITGEQGWNKAAAVYVEFGDLSRTNGYKLLAVLDDRDQASGPDVEGLLQQVGSVTRWSRRNEWLETVAQRRLV
jgi:hypothetical protein